MPGRATTSQICAIDDGKEALFERLPLDIAQDEGMIASVVPNERLSSNRISPVDSTPRALQGIGSSKWTKGSMQKP
eukprot:607155-Hanusia_phi.AAC.6